VLGIAFVLLVVIFLYSGNSYPYTPIVGKPSTMLEKLDHGIKINGVPICDLHYALPDCVETDPLSGVESVESTFVQLYNSNAWGKTKSGTSDDASTVSLRKHLQQFIRDYHIKSILDAPCGDNTYIAMMDLDEVTYLGIDIVSQNIELNRDAYPKKFYLHQDVKVELGNVTFDLVITRALLQHLTLQQGIDVLKKVLKRGNYIMLTTFLTGENLDLPTGHHYFTDIFRKPFCFNEPLVLFPDFNLQRGDKNLMYAAIWEISKLKHCLQKNGTTPV